MNGVDLSMLHSCTLKTIRTKRIRGCNEILQYLISFYQNQSKVLFYPCLGTFFVHQAECTFSISWYVLLLIKRQGWRLQLNSSWILYVHSVPDYVKVLSLLEGCLYLISSPSPSVKIQTKGGKIFQKSGVRIPNVNHL